MPVRIDAPKTQQSYKRPEISQVIGFMSDTAYSISEKMAIQIFTIKPDKEENE